MPSQVSSQAGSTIPTSLRSGMPRSGSGSTMNWKMASKPTAAFWYSSSVASVSASVSIHSLEKTFILPPPFGTALQFAPEPFPVESLQVRLEIEYYGVPVGHRLHLVEVEGQRQQYPFLPWDPFLEYLDVLVEPLGVLERAHDALDLAPGELAVYQLLDGLAVVARHPTHPPR